MTELKGRGGHSSQGAGRQNLMGPAIDRTEQAADNNNAAPVDNDKWRAEIQKNKDRMDRLYDKIFKD